MKASNRIAAVSAVLLLSGCLQATPLLDQGTSAPDSGSDATTAGTADASQVVVDAGWCGVQAPYVSPAELGASPRENLRAELLALELHRDYTVEPLSPDRFVAHSTGPLMATQADYQRIAAELSAIEAAFPKLAGSWVNPLFDPNLLSLAFTSADSADSVLDGGSPAFDCLNSLYGAVSVKKAASYAPEYVSIEFKARLNTVLLADLYRKAVGADVTPSVYTEYSPDICVAQEPEGDVFIYGLAPGSDCASSCNPTSVTAVRVASDGGVELLGELAAPINLDALPTWLASRATACRGRLPGIFLLRP